MSFQLNDHAGLSEISHDDFWAVSGSMFSVTACCLRWQVDLVSLANSVRILRLNFDTTTPNLNEVFASLP